jgi:hypothetical protein
LVLKILKKKKRGGLEPWTYTISNELLTSKVQPAHPLRAVWPTKPAEDLARQPVFLYKILNLFRFCLNNLVILPKFIYKTHGGEGLNPSKHF